MLEAFTWQLASVGVTCEIIERRHPRSANVCRELCWICYPQYFGFVFIQLLSCLSQTGSDVVRCSPLWSDMVSSHTQMVIVSLSESTVLGTGHNAVKGSSIWRGVSLGICRRQVVMVQTWHAVVDCFKHGMARSPMVVSHLWWTVSNSDEAEHRWRRPQSPPAGYVCQHGPSLLLH